MKQLFCSTVLCVSYANPRGGGHSFKDSSWSCCCVSCPPDECQDRTGILACSCASSCSKVAEQESTYFKRTGAARAV
jgi:hypothetical protein